MIGSQEGMAGDLMPSTSAASASAGVQTQTLALQIQHQNLPPCYPLSPPSFYFTTRPRNRRKLTIWPHRSYRVSLSPPEYISSFLSILTAVEPSGTLSGHWLGPLYSFSMCILSGKGLGMQVFDNTPPSQYKCTDRKHLIPSSPNIIPHLYIHHSTLYMHLF